MTDALMVARFVSHCWIYWRPFRPPRQAPTSLRRTTTTAQQLLRKGLRHGAVAPRLLDEWDFINIELMDEKRLAPRRFPATIISQGFLETRRSRDVRPT